MEPLPPEQYRNIAAINQQPVYFPNALGMERLKWVWGIIVVLALAIFYGALKYKDLSDTAAAFKKIEPEHRKLWEQRERGQSNKEVFFLEHGYPAPGQPEK